VIALAPACRTGQSGAVGEYGRVRRIALALPGVRERISHGEPCFFVQDRRALCYFHDNHNDDGRISLWCPVPPGVQEEMVSADPERFFKPPTSARGVFADWLGVYLDTISDTNADWDEVAAIVRDAYRNIAPTALVDELDRRPR
jgi:hypothetical protein